MQTLRQILYYERKLRHQLLHAYFDGQTRTCQELAAQENYKAKANENPALRIYSKYYKRYAARVRSKQLKEKEFKSWKYKAITMRDECTEGNITAEEYIAWLETYFPNRKQRN